MLKYERINSNASFYENDSGCIINHIYIAPVVASNGSIIVESSIAKSIIEQTYNPLPKNGGLFVQ